MKSFYRLCIFSGRQSMYVILKVDNYDDGGESSYEIFCSDSIERAMAKLADLTSGVIFLAEGYSKNNG